MKKWTYLAVAGMLLGSAPVFTGCIDNDEPAGITDLRGAKAELLRAKAAVEAARVAEVQAQAALLQAQAAVEEANAVKIQAEAEKVRAEAAIAQAKADYINAKTEAAKAEAQAIIDENERKQAEWEEQAAVRAAQAEAAIKQAQLATAEALAKYQTVVAALQDTKNKALQPYISKLETATKDYYEALDNLRGAQRDYNNQSAANEESEASKDLKTRDLQREVMLKQKGYDGAVAALERAKTELEEAKTLEPHALAVKYDEVLEERNTIWKEVADLSVKAAEEAVKIFNEQVIPYRALLNEITELQNETQTLPAVTFDFGSTGDFYPAYVERGPIELEEMEYSFNDPSNYLYRKYVLETLVRDFKAWTRDANDNAWTNETIVSLQGQSDALKKQIDEVKKTWQEAVDAYKTGIYNTTDPSKITGYAEVTAGITAFNEAAADVNEAYATYSTLTIQMQKDADARDKTLENNLKTYNTAYTAATNAYDAAIATAATDFESEKKALEDAETAAKKNYDDAVAAYNEVATGTDAAAIAEALATKNQMEILYQAAMTANSNFTYPAYLQELEDTRDKAYADAATAKLTADKAANDAYNAKWNTTNGTEYVKIAPAYQAIGTAQEVLDGKCDELIDAAEDYNNALPELVNAGMAPITTSDITAAATPQLDSKLGYNQVKTLDVKTLIVLSKESMEEVVKFRSEILYGTGYATNAYGDNIGRLVELTDAEILADVDAAMDEIEATEERNVTLADYLDKCFEYGLAGRRLALEEQIRIAKSWLNNSEAINGKIAEAEAALKAVTDGYDALEASIKAKQEEADLAYETLQADLEDTYAEAEAKRQELEPLDGLLAAIGHAITDYQNAGEDVYTQEGIDALISALEEQIQGIELEVFDAETLLLQAQNNLAKWNADAISWLEVLAQRVEDAQIAVDRAKDKLDNVQAALDAVIAALINDPTADATETPETPAE